MNIQLICLTRKSIIFLENQLCRINKNSLYSTVRYAVSCAHILLHTHIVKHSTYETLQVHNGHAQHNGLCVLCIHREQDPRKPTKYCTYVVHHNSELCTPLVKGKHRNGVHYRGVLFPLPTNFTKVDLA